MPDISADHSSILAEKSLSEFLDYLKQGHIQIQAHEGRLKINAPAGAVDAALQSELKRRKPALLEALGKGELSPALTSLSDAELKEKIPLTPAQQGMWLIEHFNPGNVAYNISEAFRLEQSIDRTILQAAVDRLVRRHRILRTSFHEVDGELFQSIAESVAAPVDFTDLSSLSPEQSDRRCRKTFREAGRRPFDLKQAPLARFHLFRLGEYSYVVLFNIHHIIADRISLYVMREELIALGEAIYRAGDAPCSDADAGLPPVLIQYAEYAVWLDRQMRSEAIERQVGYWKEKLSGLPPFIDVQHSLPRPEKRSAWGATKPVLISAETAAALKRVGTEESASSFMTFLAAYAVLIAHSSQILSADGTADFCIGSPITHRRNVATKRMIGLFVNMLAFRCTVSSAMTFRELLRQVRSTALEAYENSDVPFQRLVKVLKTDRRSQRSPVFQAMFGYETYMPPVSLELPMDTDPGTARYDLSLHLAESAGGALHGSVEYCTDLFTEADAAKLAAEFEAIVAGIVNNPDQNVAAMKVVVPSPEPVVPMPSQVPGPKPEIRPSGFKRLGRLFSSRK